MKITHTYFYQKLVESKGLNYFIKEHPNVEILLLETEINPNYVIKLYLNTQKGKNIYKVIANKNEYPFENLLDSYDFLLTLSNELTTLDVENQKNSL